MYYLISLIASIIVGGGIGYMGAVNDIPLWMVVSLALLLGVLFGFLGSYLDNVNAVNGKK